MAKAKVLKDKQGNTIYPVTDVSLILGLKDGFMDVVEVDTLPTASGQTRGILYMVPSTQTVGEYDRYITKFENGSYSWKQLTSTTVPSPVVADNLTTDDAAKALSAKQGKVLDGKVTQLGQEVDPLSGGSYSPSYEIIDGYSIGTNGTKYANRGYAYTSPIRLAKGSVITAHCRGESTTICIISAKTENPAYPGPLVICDGSTVRDYTYEARDDMEVIICYNKSDGLTVNVTAPVGVKTLAALDDRLTIATEENLSPSFTVGSYVTNSGSVDSSNNFEMSAPIPLVKGDVLIMYARGYNSVVSILSRVNGSGYTPVIIGDNMFSRYVYKCQNDAESVVISCSFVQGVRIIKISSSDEYRKVLEAASKTFPVVTSGKYTPEHTVEMGKYLDMNGNVRSNSNFSMTSPVRVNKGDLITVRAKGYLTSVSMISAAQPGGKYAGLVISTDSNVNDYTLVAPWSGEYVACFNTATGLIEFSITPNGSELGRMEDSLADMDATELNLQSESGQYINSAGVITSQGNFSLTEEFTLNRGDAILVYASGYLSEVTILSKVTGVNTYEPLIIGSSAMQEFTYVNTGDAASFRISFRTLIGLRVIKVASAVRAQLIKDLSTEGGLLFSSYVDSFAFAGIPVVGIIGDSLAMGTSYNGGDSSLAEYPAFAWWRVLERDSGATYKSFARGGLTTRTWFTNPEGSQKALANGNKCCAYVIGLGVNDQWSLGMGYLGTASDVDLADYHNNADTFYGNYAKIIQMLSEHVSGAKFFLLTIPRTSESYDAFNAAIRVLANMFDNCYLVDLATNYMDSYQSGFIRSQMSSDNHYSASAYQVMGRIMEMAISDVMAKNAADFKYIQFVSTT